MDTINFKKYAILLLFISLSSCELFEDYDRRTYYDVTGVGYVYYKETKEPVPDASVCVMSSFRSKGWATVHPIYECFPTDGNGYFSVKFLKRTSKENVLRYSIGAGNENYTVFDGRGQNFTLEEVQKAKGTIRVDTLWLVRNLTSQRINN